MSGHLGPSHQTNTPKMPRHPQPGDARVGTSYALAMEKDDKGTQAMGLHQKPGTSQGASPVGHIGHHSRERWYLNLALDGSLAAWKDYI